MNLSAGSATSVDLLQHIIELQKMRSIQLFSYTFYNAENGAMLYHGDVYVMLTCIGAQIMHCGKNVEVIVL